MRDRRRGVHSSWSSDSRNFLFLSASLPRSPRTLPSTMTLLASERSLLIRNKFRSGEDPGDSNHTGWRGEGFISPQQWLYISGIIGNISINIWRWSVCVKVIGSSVTMSIMRSIEWRYWSRWMDLTVFFTQRERCLRKDLRAAEISVTMRHFDQDVGWFVELHGETNNGPWLANIYMEV